MKHVVLLLSVLISSSLSASVITYENRKTNAGVDKSDYQASWNNQTSQIRSRDLDTFTRLRAQGSNRHQHSHLSVSFNVGSAFAGLDWLFQFSPDAGKGGALYFDGNLVEKKTTDLWWGYNWNRSAELISALIPNVGTGTHTIDLFWAENCCNGGQSGRYSLDNGETWLALSTDNLNAVDVPEPATLAILCIGLAGLSLSRRASKKDDH